MDADSIKTFKLAVGLFLVVIGMLLAVTGAVEILVKVFKF